MIKRKRKLKIKYYIRYADDFVILTSSTYKECVDIKMNITKFLKDNLGLELNKDKTIMQRLYNAVKELFGFKRERLFDLMNRSVDDIFRVNYEAFQTVPSLMEDINLLLTKPEGYTILNKILNKMRECN